MTKEGARDERTTVHIEADAGSSLFSIEIKNADAAQLFAIAGIIHANANVALAAQMASQEARRAHLVVPEGRLS